MKITKRSVTASEEMVHESAVSFDFIAPEEGYPSEMGGDLMEAIDMLGYESFGYDFVDVDYSNYSDYAEYNDRISQGSIDFKWSETYSEEEITYSLSRVLDSYGCDLIGVDFYAIEK